MNTEEKAGADLQSADIDARRQAARLMGRAKTERKAATSAANGRSFAGHTEEAKERIREGQRAAWAKRKAAQAEKTEKGQTDDKHSG